MGWRSHGGSSKGATLTPLTSTYFCFWKLANPRSQCIAPMLLCSKLLVTGQASMTVRQEARPRPTAPQKTVVSCLYIFQKMNGRHTPNTEDRREPWTIIGPTRRNGQGDIGSRQPHGVSWIKLIDIYNYVQGAFSWLRIFFMEWCCSCWRSRWSTCSSTCSSSWGSPWASYGGSSSCGSISSCIIQHCLDASWDEYFNARVYCRNPDPAPRWDHSMFVIIDVMSCLAGAPMGEGIRGAMAAAGLLAQDGYFSWDECNRFLSGLQQARNSQVWGSLAFKDVV